jgi:ATPase
LIGKVELGLVSQVLDTILHVEAGAIQQVLELRMTVKAPTGMQEELARPVIEVVEFPSGKITHEMFAFGSEIAVVPVEGNSRGLSPMKSLAKEALIQKIREWIGVESQIQILSDASANIYVPSNMISTLVGRGGENIRQLQDDLGGIALSVKSLDEMPEGMDSPRSRYRGDKQDSRSKAGRAWENPSRGSKGRGRNSKKGRR